MSSTKLLLLCSLVLAASCFYGAAATASKGHLYTYKWKNLTKTTTKNLTVHVIAHTHCDPGWLKTFDDYYIGARNDIQWAGVRYIIDAVVQELAMHPDRKFIWVEISFFSRWWKEQKPQTQTLVNKLIDNGQLEFISGGWVMHDEAASYYEDQIDNMAVGHQFLKDTFNYKPKIGWQIDPFGHSATTAAFFSKMGFNGYWFARPDYQHKAQRLVDKSMEMIWVPNTSQGNENQIFGAFTYNEYAAPRGFCYDITCSDDPISYDPTMMNYNLDEKLADITNYFRNMSEAYQSDHLIHTWGEDFNFQAAGAYYRNLDILMDVVNSRYDQYGIKMIYSTPSQYLKALNSKNITFPKNVDDFFPYADRPNAFWTGYFTSRVSQKGYTRHSGRLFQNIRRLVAQKLLSDSSVYLKKQLKAVLATFASAEENRGLLQHHDAVAGTAKQRVKEDYMYRMEKSMNEIHAVATNKILQEETKATFGIDSDYTSCLLNTTAEACKITQKLVLNSSLLVAIHNTIQERDQVVRIKVPQTNIQVYTLSKTRGMLKLETDIICSNKTSPNDCDLFFFDHFNATSTQFYTLKSVPYSNQVVSSYKMNPKVLEEAIQVSPFKSITMIGDHSTFVVKDRNQSHVFRLRYNYYPSYCDGPSDYYNSGAYLFRPQNQSINGSSPYSMPSQTAVFSGKVVTQITLYSDKVITNIRLENRESSTPGIELETFIDSISIEDQVGKEIVLLVDAPEINSNDIWYTDSNGMEMQKRKRNHRPQWNLSTEQFASANYYPITSAICIQDSKSGVRATLLTDRAHGATSLQSGQIEVMLHRRILCDDKRGLNEVLNETDYDGQGLRQWFNQRLIFSNSSNEQRTAQFQLDQPLLVFLSAHDEHFEFHSVRKAREASAASKIPKNVKISFKPLAENEYVVWLHNMNEANVSVAINSLNEFLTEGAHRPTYQELTLTGNQLKSEMIRERMIWKGAGQPTYDPKHEKIRDEIRLRGLEIRCFKLSI